MSINDVAQKRTLLNKLGLGTPKMASNITVSQNQSKPVKPQQTNPPSPKPAQPAQPKPGCGGCRRKRPK
jgi:hypothetical protein